jgi:hypothetical protein
MINEKIDRRKKYYLILDCETATLPYASKFEEEQKKNIAIAKPLIYDLGWQVIDRNGKVYKRKSYLISEIFSVPQVFNTGYYAHKRPIYLERLRKGETILTDWNTAIEDLINDMQYVESVGAYNSMFDFKKAIPFTELYINMLYSSEFYEWEKMQNKLCDSIAYGRFNKPTREFEPDIFRFRNNAYDLFDVWGLSCEHIMNNNEYKQMCIDNGWQTASGKYFKTSAETCFRYFSNEIEFEESHTAIDDTIIESQLFVEILRITKFKFEMGIIYFPFRTLGTVEDFEMFGV